MPKFRKKPVVIEAEQYFDDVVSRPFMHGDSPVRFDEELGRQYIYTLEGPLCVSNGDWVVRGVQGEYYPVKPDIFEKTYEPVTE